MATAEAAAALGDGADGTDDDEDDWQFPQSAVYLPYLLHLMSFVDGRLESPYPKDTIFTKERLLEVACTSASAHQDMDEFQSLWRYHSWQ
jgi:hypothetical protein